MRKVDWNFLGTTVGIILRPSIINNFSCEILIFLRSYVSFHTAIKRLQLNSCNRMVHMDEGTVCRSKIDEQLKTKHFWK